MRIGAHTGQELGSCVSVTGQLSDDFFLFGQGISIRLNVVGRGEPGYASFVDHGIHGQSQGRAHRIKLSVSFRIDPQGARDRCARGRGVVASSNHVSFLPLHHFTTGDALVVAIWYDVSMSLQISAVRLEQAAEIAAREAGISDYTWFRFIDRLRLLKDHNLGMYAHSLRVGLYAYGVASSEGQEDCRLPLLGGCGHDVGKCRVPNSILDSTEPLTPSDFEAIHRHPEDSYEILKSDFPLAAMVAGLHHKFTPKAYGIELKDAPPWLQSAHTHKVIEATMLVMLCDFFDAITTRRNASTVIDPDDTGPLIEFLKKNFPDFPTRTDWLADHRSNLT